jgi:hypothetical protein
VAIVNRPEIAELARSRTSVTLTQRRLRRSRALFRYPHYHLPSDTPDKVDHERLARITKGLERVVRE